MKTLGYIVMILAVLYFTAMGTATVLYLWKGPPF